MIVIPNYEVLELKIYLLISNFHFVFFFWNISFKLNISFQLNKLIVLFQENCISKRIEVEINKVTLKNHIKSVHFDLLFRHNLLLLEKVSVQLNFHFLRQEM